MTSSRATHARHHTQILGAIGLAVIVAVSAFLIATYQRAFADVVNVTVETDRGGLLLDTGARVRMSGVAVGEVRSTELTDDGRVRVSVAIEADKADSVPADVVASIRATTVFGAKFVDLRIPEGGSAADAIGDGEVIEASEVTVEVNDVFAHGLDVLKAVQPAKLNSTLTAASTALDGRGDRFGQFFTDWDRYLGALEPHLGALETDLAAAPGVLDTYADVAPQLIDTGDNFATTSETLTARQDQLHALLGGTVEAADAAAALLLALEQPLLAFNEQWLPVSGLGAEYAPAVGCIIESLNKHIHIFDKFFGNPAEDEHYFYAMTGFLPSAEPYTLAENRPKLVTGVGPACYREATAADPTVPHIDFDDGTAGTYSEASTGSPAGPADDPLQVYTDLVGDWFGTDVLSALLPALQGAEQ
ncbi:MCE family protein [Nocardioides immobilis]|uniref:MCE family protein n=1 Tax=Nocardioides immobilis TaxID=2049295 RepID=A0A417Y615_9ACTN|nr:MCE family protein [Nocardioides immobilis]RHW28138.1 MCE family protein [Nocardioides immobilis]